MGNNKELVKKEVVIPASVSALAILIFTLFSLNPSEDFSSYLEGTNCEGMTWLLKNDSIKSAEDIQTIFESNNCFVVQNAQESALTKYSVEGKEYFKIHNPTKLTAIRTDIKTFEIKSANEKIATFSLKNPLDTLTNRLLDCTGGYTCDMIFSLKTETALKLSKDDLSGDSFRKIATVDKIFYLREINKTYFYNETNNATEKQIQKNYTITETIEETDFNTLTFYPDKEVDIHVRFVRESLVEDDIYPSVFGRDYDEFSIWGVGGTEYTVLVNGTNYTVHVFTSNSTFNVTHYLSNVSVLVIGEGGGGANRYYSSPVCSEANTGGGAGGYRYFSNLTIPANSYNITVTKNAKNYTSPSCENGLALNGGNTTFWNITAAGGGAGLGGKIDSVYGGSQPGGSGGGGLYSLEPAIGAPGNVPATTPPQGWNGGVSELSYFVGGGGGACGNATGYYTGGIGCVNDINGSNVTYATGGSGLNTPTNYGDGNGGAGVVIIRYKTINEHPWEDPDYLLRNRYNITTNTTQEMYNYTASINISINRTYTDINDFRMTYINSSDEEEEIGFWRRSDNWTNGTYDTVNASGTIDFKLPYVSGNNSTVVYLYYNASGKTDVSNISNAYLIGDDFLGSSLNTNLWTRRTGGGGSSTIGVSDSNITFSITASNTDRIWVDIIEPKEQLPTTNYTVTAKVSSIAGSATGSSGGSGMTGVHLSFSFPPTFSCGGIGGAPCTLFNVSMNSQKGMNSPPANPWQQNNKRAFGITKNDFGGVNVDQYQNATTTTNELWTFTKNSTHILGNGKSFFRYLSNDSQFNLTSDIALPPAYTTNNFSIGVIEYSAGIGTVGIFDYVYAKSYYPYIVEAVFDKTEPKPYPVGELTPSFAYVNDTIEGSMWFAADTNATDLTWGLFINGSEYDTNTIYGDLEPYTNYSVFNITQITKGSELVIQVNGTLNNDRILDSRNSSTLVIHNFVPVLSLLNISPTPTIFDYDTINVSVIAYDIDADTLTFYYSWFLNDTNQTSLAGSTTLTNNTLKSVYLNSSTAGGFKETDMWKVVGYVSDEEDSSEVNLTESTTVNVSSIINLSYGITAIKFIPRHGLDTNVTPVNQTSSIGLFNLSNPSIHEYNYNLYLNSTKNGIIVYCSPFSNQSEAITLTTAPQLIITLTSKNSSYIWCWANYSNPSGTTWTPKFRFEADVS